MRSYPQLSSWITIYVNTGDKVLSEELIMLLRERAEIDARLRDHEWVVNANNPIAEIAENIVAQMFGGERAPNNSTGHDVLLPNGQKIEVKSRRLRDGEESQFNAIKLPFEFDVAVFVVFNMDYSIREVGYVHAESIEHVSNWSNRNNGWAAQTRKVREAYIGGVDYTSMAREVWNADNLTD